MNIKLKPIEEQVIVITGASSGIGLATARLAAERGAKVVLASRNLKDLNEIVKDIKSRGGQAIAIKADVSEEADLIAVKDAAIKEFGQINTWVNNAGASIYGKLIDLELKEEKLVFDTNVWGIRNGCHAAVDALRENGGTIINLGSEVSERAIPLQGIYSASKHAVKAYTESLRVELVHDKIPIYLTLIRPTAINTPFPVHALNRLESGYPNLPDSNYDPKVVAEAILSAAVSPKRDIYVGGQSKFNAVMEAISPHLADYFVEKTGFSMNQTSKRHAQDEGLTKAPRKEGSVHGIKPLSKEKNASIYTSASSHPLATIASLALLGAAAAVATRYLKK